MKQGNQFFLEIKVMNKKKEVVVPEMVDKIVFTIGDLTRTFVSDGEEVSFDEEKGVYKIWLTQEDTFKFEENVSVETRVKFTNNVIIGSTIEKKSVYDSINKEVL